MPESEKLKTIKRIHGCIINLVSQSSKCSSRGRPEKKELTKISFDKLERYTVLAQKIEQMKKMVAHIGLRWILIDRFAE